MRVVRAAVCALLLLLAMAPTARSQNAAGQVSGRSVEPGGSAPRSQSGQAPPGSPTVSKDGKLLRPTAVVTGIAAPSNPTISQDGKLLAYAAAGEAGKLDIWVRKLSGGAPALLVRQGRQPCLSPDGGSVAFHSDQDGGIHLISVTGGRDRLVASAGWNPRFAPDGQRIAYWSGNPTAGAVFAGEHNIHVLDLFSGVDSVIWTRGAVSGITAGADLALNPVWSPGGSRLIFTNLTVLWTLPASGGTPTRVDLSSALASTGGALAGVGDWDKDGILIDVRLPQAGSMLSIWRIPVDPLTASVTGRAQQLTAGTVNEAEPRSSGDGHLVYSSRLATTNLYYASLDANAGKVTGPLTPVRRSAGPDIEPSISLDGRMLVFRYGTRVLLRDLQTGEERTVSESSAHAAVSRDGTMVAFRGGLSGVADLVAGRSPIVVPISNAAYCWTHDNSRILYMGSQAPPVDPGLQAIMDELKSVSSPTGTRNPAEASALLQRLKEATANRQPGAGPRYVVSSYNLATGKGSVVLDHPDFSVFEAFLSPDDGWIAFNIQDPANPAAIYVARADAENRIDPKNWIPINVGKPLSDKPRWSPDGRLLYFVSERDGSRCVWAQRLDAGTKRPIGEPFEVLHLQDEQLSMRSMNSSALEIGVALDKLVLPLTATYSGIWIQ